VTGLGGTAQAVAVRGATLQTYRYGSTSPEAPTVLLVHGYPDDHHLFDPLVAELGDDLRIVSYDYRAAGRSRVDDPGTLESFRLPVLAEDLYAVAASVPGAGRIHVFAHDWGSIQAWEAMRDPRAARTFASYTSVAGPSIDHLRVFLRRNLRRPRRWPVIAGQLLRSWYVFGYAVPGLRAATRRAYRAAGRGDFSGIDVDIARGVDLYRASILQRMLTGPAPHCPVPTTLVVPRHDRFLSVHLADGVRDWAPDVEVVTVDAGHWWPRTHPAEAAAVLRARIHAH
jgi:pimeloyl-ACP methyl ester carboxylesterase